MSIPTSLRCAIALLAAILMLTIIAPVAAAKAQNSFAGWSDGSGYIARLARTDAAMITVTKSHRNDAQSCQAVTGREMGRALYSCLPLLEVYRAFEPLRLNLMTRGYLPDPDSDFSISYAENAEKFFALAKNREYPAGDVALVMAHEIQSQIFASRKQYGKAVGELNAAIDIIATTKIRDPEFDIRSVLKARIAGLEGHK